MTTEATTDGSLARICIVALVLIFLSGCEIVGEVIGETDLSYCSGCDWIVQEYHEGWETHNSKPYDDEAACQAARLKQQKKDKHVLLRCIHESDLH